MADECRFRSAYDGRRVAVIVDCPTSRTRQSFRDECDVNVILKMYARTGVLPGDPSQAQFGDFTDVDFMRSMLIVAQGREAFASLPATLRERFGNDPARLLSFLADESNRDEAVRLGLVVPKEVPAAAPVPGGAPPGTSTAP